MTPTSGLRRGMVVGLLLAATAAAAAQAPATGPGQAADVARDPIRCWWKTDTSTVHVAEHFALTLTCAVADSGRMTVVPDVTQLEPRAVLLPPFEVVGG